MINLQYEFTKKFLIKPQMTKTSQENNLNYINFLKHFYEYHTEKFQKVQRCNMAYFKGFAMMNLLLLFFVATFSHL